jgi:NtrC-family two-component system sensor histidine kinase KinB
MARIPLERRVPLLFAGLALCVLALLALSWRAYDELGKAQRWRDHSREVLAELDALTFATAAQPVLLLCAANGAAPAELPPPVNALAVWQRLQALTRDAPAQQSTLEELPPLIQALDDGYFAPLREACGANRRLGFARALELSTIGITHRGAIERYVQQMRTVEQGLLRQREDQLRMSRQSVRRLFALFGVGTVLLALVATVGLRGFTARLADSHRWLRREATERGMAQEQQRETQRRLEMVLDHIPDAVIAFDAGARVQWINPACEAMFGRAGRLVRGQPISLLVPELDHWMRWPDTEPPEGAADAPGGAWSTRRETMYGVRADGHEFPLETALVHALVNGERVGVCVCRDLSALERLDRMKHEFVSMVSHELRTPLTSLRGALATLVDGMGGELSAPARRLVDQARGHGERLGALVDDILDFERLRAGEVRMQLETLQLATVARRAIDACAGEAQQRRVTIELQTGELPVWVRADAPRLAQVLTHLLGNAVRFSPEGAEVQVVVAARDSDACLWVIDSGPGVPPALVERLFEPFARADAPGAREPGGSGLGLAISRALMEQMGGLIALEPPRPGQGAVFWISLPQQPSGPSGDELPA